MSEWPNYNSYIRHFLRKCVRCDLSKCKISKFSLLIKLTAFPAQTFVELIYSNNNKYFGGNQEKHQLQIRYYEQSGNYKSIHSPNGFLWELVNQGKAIQVIINGIKTKVIGHRFFFRHLKDTFGLILILGKKAPNCNITQQTGAKI